MTPKVTAIVSAYYAEPFLQGRLENLLAQNMGDALEIVVVCLKDSPESLITQGVHWQEHPKMKLIETDDTPTVYVAWNQGIEVSHGEFITNANSDDLLYDGALSRMVQELDGHAGSAVAYADVDRTIEYGGSPQSRFEWMEGGLPELYWKGCFLGPMPLWRRALHDKYGLFDPEMRSAGDYDFWVRLAAEGEKFHHIKGFVCGAHLERQDALEHREPVRSLWEQSRIKRKVRHIMDVVK